MMQFPLPPFDGKTKAECNYYSWTATGSGYQSESDNDAKEEGKKKGKKADVWHYILSLFLAVPRRVIDAFVSHVQG